MEITIERKSFLDGIQQIQSVVERKNTIPILSHVLIETKEAGISITATDLEVSIQTFLPASIEQPGSITLSAQKLFEILRELPEAIVHLKTEENHWATIRCQSSTFRLAGFPKVDFPELPAVKTDDTFGLEQNTIKSMIAKTSFAISHDPNRNALTGSLFLLDDSGLFMIATDGHRLAVTTKPRPEGYAFKNFEVIVPFKTILEVKKLCNSEEPITIALGNNQIIFSEEYTTLISRLIEAQFPDYKQVIPKVVQYHVEVNKEALHRAVRRVSLLSNEKSRLIRFMITPDLLTLICNDPDLGEAKEEIPVKYTGDEIAIGFNAKYVIDFLSVVEGENISIEFNDPLSPGLFASPEEKDFQCVIMPMRV
jgi:DNA polymerase-3 subunit beta